MSVNYHPDGTPVALDALGQTIHPGDKIIYSAADGRSSVLRRGVVRDIYVSVSSSYAQKSDTVKLSIEAERLAHNFRDPQQRTWHEIDRRVTLGFTSRVVVVDRSAW